MKKTRPNLKVNRPRCPYCHDNIVPGGDNRACHGCLTWHHEECWGYGGCVTCGGEVSEHETPKPSTGVMCVHHTPDKVSPRALRDLKDLWGWGPDQIPCTCPKSEAKGPSKEYWDKHPPQIGGSLALNRLVSMANRLIKTPPPTDEVPKGTALVGSTCHSCHRTYTRLPGMKDCGCVAEKQARCAHKWNPENYQCFRCDQVMSGVYRERYVESFIEDQVDDEILDECIVCMSYRCDEPSSRRGGGFCSLCMVEAEIWGDSRADGLTPKERRDALHDYEALTATTDAPSGWMILAIVVIITVAVVWRLVDA